MLVACHDEARCLVEALEQGLTLLELRDRSLERAKVLVARDEALPEVTVTLLVDVFGNVHHIFFTMIRAERILDNAKIEQGVRQKHEALEDLVQTSRQLIGVDDLLLSRSEA